MLIKVQMLNLSSSFLRRLNVLSCSTLHLKLTNFLMILVNDAASLLKSLTNLLQKLAKP
jgi:hypothetical protein